MDLIYTYHPAWLLLITPLAFVYAYLLYRKDEQLDEVKEYLKWIMGSLRFSAVWILMFLLLGIVLGAMEDRKEKPLVFLAHDFSESVLMNADSNFYQTTYLENLKELSNGLSEEYDVVEYGFAENLSDGFEREYNGKLTNISAVFNQIFDQYTNRNIGAIVLSSDGIYNTGANPIYSIARKNYLPIFTVGLGDTNQVRDVQIKEIKHNEIAFLGNQFPVEVIVNAAKCEGETVKIGVYSNDKLIKEERVEFKDDDEQKTVNFVLQANKIGYQKYKVKVSELSNEFSVQNNASNFYVEVIDGRQKLLIAHSGPHPDISAMRFVIDNNKNYQVEVMRMDEVESVSNYDLVVLHNYEPSNPIIKDAVDQGSTPFLFIVGNQTNISALSNAKIGLNGNRTDFEEVGYRHNPNFKDILLSPETVKMLGSAPPLQAPFGNFNYSSAINVLAYQKVGNIQLESPLIYFTQKNTNRCGVIMGEGIWRWRLYDQARNGNTTHFEELISKLITYLAIKDNKDPFKIHIKNEFSESENVFVKGELYNKSYELINEPDVRFVLENEAGEQFENYFVPVANHYELNLGKLAQGIYHWKASTEFQNVQHEKEGTVLVREVKLELLNSRANHRLLRNIAENSNGAFYLPTGLNRLEDDLKNRDDLVTIVYQEKSFSDLIDFKWIFFLVVLLLTIEWFMRKYHGAY